MRLVTAYGMEAGDSFRLLKSPQQVLNEYKETPATERLFKAIVLIEGCPYRTLEARTFAACQFNGTAGGPESDSRC